MGVRAPAPGRPHPPLVQGVPSPQGLLAAPQVVLQDDAGHCAALAHASAITDEEASTLPTGEQDLVLLWWGEVVVRTPGKRSGIHQDHPPSRGLGSSERPESHLAGVGDGLQLQGGQDTTVRGRQGKGVGDVGGWDAGQRAGLHHTVWVLLPNLGWRGVARAGQGHCQYLRVSS